MHQKLLFAQAYFPHHVTNLLLFPGFIFSRCKLAFKAFLRQWESHTRWQLSQRCVRRRAASAASGRRRCFFISCLFSLVCLKMGGLFAAVFGFYSNQLKTELRSPFMTGMKPWIDCLPENQQPHMAVPHVPVKHMHLPGKCSHISPKTRINQRKSLWDVSWVMT